MFEGDGPARPMSLEITTRCVLLHKEQFGRGPNHAAAYFAGSHVLVVVLDDVLLPAEKALVDAGLEFRVLESRSLLEQATSASHIAIVEEVTGRQVTSFSGGLDVQNGIAHKVFLLARDDAPAAVGA